MTDWRAYSDLVVGDTFPEEPFCFAVTEEIARGFRDLTAKTLAGSSDAKQDATVPPMLAAVYIRGAQNALKGPPGGIHAKQHFTFLKPVHVGDRLETTLTIKDKYERKGRPYVVTQTRTRNQDGVEVTLGEMVLIWGQGA